MHSQLDERQLEKLDKVLEEEQLKEDEAVTYEDEEVREEGKDEVNQLSKPQLDDVVSQTPSQRPDDLKSVASSAVSRKVSSYTAITMINRLERQLSEERSEREKMRQEIDELKKMNCKLASAISNSSQSAAVQAPAKAI